MNPTRVTYIRENLAVRADTVGKFESKQLEGLKILDVGCGGGLLSESLARLGAQMTSIDPSASNIDVARRHSMLDDIASTIDYRNTTVEAVLDSGEVKI